MSNSNEDKFNDEAKRFEESMNDIKSTKSEPNKSSSNNSNSEASGSESDDQKSTSSKSNENKKSAPATQNHDATQINDGKQVGEVVVAVKKPEGSKRSRSRSNSKHHRRRSSSRSRHHHSSSHKSSHHRRHHHSSSSKRERSRSGDRHRHHKRSSDHHKHSSSHRRHRSPDTHHDRDRDRRQRTRSRERPKQTETKLQQEIQQLQNQQATAAAVGITQNEMGESKSLSLVDLMKEIELPKHIRPNTQEAIKYKAEMLRIKTEEKTGVKVPTYYNSTAINPLAFAEQQRKRKLLWSKAKDNENTTTTIVGKAIVDGQDERTAQKFRKLMGIRDGGAGGGDEEDVQNSNRKVEELSKMQQNAFEALDKEYAFARMATHTHRGIGLGFISHVQSQQQPPSNK